MHSLARLFVCIVLAGFFGPSARGQISADLLVSEIVDSVKRDSLVHFVRVLTGDTVVTVNGAPARISSRHWEYADNDTAALFLREKLASFGLVVSDHFFGERGRNILAYQEGRLPGAHYMIGAHYDAMPDSTYAPGADDNASGTAAVLEAARVLSTVSTEHPVIYAFWDEEETGLVGARNYAAGAAGRGEEILGVINLDMIGWDGNGDRVAAVHSRSVASADTVLVQTVHRTNEEQALGLTVLDAIPGTRRSDHAAFWEQDYPAILIIEHFSGSDANIGTDFNPYYHSTDDRLVHFDRAYYHAVAQLATGTIARLALGSETSVGSRKDEIFLPVLTLQQNYPDPFTGGTTVVFALPAAGYVSLDVFDILGRRVKSLVNERMPVGRHAVTWRPAGEPSGVYLYRLVSEHAAISRTMLYLR